MKKFLLAILLISISNFGYSQITGMTVVPTIVHNGTQCDELGWGDVTYQVFVELDSSGMYLNSITSGGEFDDTPFYMSTTTSFYQATANGANIAYDINPIFFPFEPCSEYDSWLTVGCDPNSPGTEVVGDIGLDWTDFEAGIGLDTSDIINLLAGGAIYSLSDVCSGPIGIDNEVLVGQFTTNGMFDACYKLSGSWYYTNDTQDTAAVWSDDYCMSGFFQPCDGSVSVSGALIDDESCVDFNDGMIEFSATGGTTFTSQFPDALDDYAFYINGEVVENDSALGLAPGSYELYVSDLFGCTDTLPDSIIVVEANPLLMDLTVTASIPCFGGDGEVVISASGGEGLIEYSNDGINFVPDSVFTVSGGDLSFYIQDGNGCSDIQLTTIPDPTLIDIDSTITYVSCFGNCDGEIVNTTSGGAAPYTYSWTGPNAFSSDLESIGSLCPGIYELTITDDSACSIFRTIEITEPAVLSVIAIGNSIQCANTNDGVAELEISGGTNPYTIDWFGVDSASLSVGYHSYNVIDVNGCEILESVEITAPTPLQFEAIQTTEIACYEECTGEIEVFGAGGTGVLEYSIFPNGGGFGIISTFTDLCDAVYTMTVRDENNCVLDTTFEVTQPEEPMAIFTTSDVTCAYGTNGSINTDYSGGLPPFTFQWNSSNGFSSSSAPDIANLSSGMYVFTLGYNYECSYIDSIEVFEPESPIEILEFVSHDVSCFGFCDGSAQMIVSGGTIEGGGDYTYNWGPYHKDSLCAGTYFPSVMDANGCVADTIMIINQPTAIDVSITTESTTCSVMNDGLVSLFILGGVPGYTVSGIGAEQDVQSSFINNSLFGGTYPFVITDSTGCQYFDTLMVDTGAVSDLVLSVATTPVTCFQSQNGTAIFTSAGGLEPYVYSLDGTELEESFISGLIDGEIFTVTVADSTGCSISEEFDIERIEDCFFLPNALTPNDDDENDVWDIRGLELYPESEVEVYNRWGQLLFSSVNYTVPWDGKYDGNLLPVADYYYIIDLKDGNPKITGTVTIKY